ncbi:MAG: rod shape-determining protein MreC [Sphingobacteriales bacterium]|nr:MAG: rod shape-determining protein MreC [Sphingobacteriales bacterium]
MRNLLYFLLRYNAILTFIILQIASWVLIIRYNNYQRAAIVNSANYVSGTLLLKATETQNYLHLKEINDSLVNINARLFAEVTSMQEQLGLQSIGNNCLPDSVVMLAKDTVSGKLLYNCRPAMVINSSVNKATNLITINKGTNNDIRPEMGVVSGAGIVGVVSQVSPNFSIVVPVINKSLRVSAKIKRNNFKGSLQWAELDPLRTILYEVPKHASVHVGDTIITTGYSDFFPPDILIGIVEKWTLSEGSNFYTIHVRLSTDFYNLKYVYVIDYLNKFEKNTLETNSAK